MAIDDIVAWAFWVPILLMLWLCMIIGLVALLTFCVSMLEDLRDTSLGRKIANWLKGDER